MILGGIKYSKMGITKVILIIKNPSSPRKKVEGEFLVDSGAHYTVLPQDFVKKLNLKPSREQQFSLADGKTIKRSIGGALVNFQGRQITVTVVFGKKGDSALLGITTLEAFGLMLDPFKREIYPSKLMLAKIL